ncbi:glutamate dehydrogenase [Arthrobacter sp. Hiyo8]|nr:glutamate dehydrogenase [Arthrobacter sp. Hiyo8]
MINLGGITFAFRAIEETTATAAAVARAFVVVREVMSCSASWTGSPACLPGFPANTPPRWPFHCAGSLTVQPAGT